MSTLACGKFEEGGLSALVSELCVGRGRGERKDERGSQVKVEEESLRQVKLKLDSQACSWCSEF
jgi:hypothetical protein